MCCGRAAAAHPGAIDLVITDVVMPEMSGRDLAQRLVKERPATKVLYLVTAEEHDPRRYGQADLREALVPLLAKQVTVTGMHTMNKGYHAIYVQAFELPGGKKEASK